MNKSKQNHLRNSTSPYLLQHVNNPVDWYPWGEEALAKAKREDKPILLSIGYSACHWCHVMAHESFEDEETAKLMNELFVNIKVDREERPDLDKIYQTAHQILTQRPGGWPLTIFLTPDGQIPFFAGTYFPPRAGFGRTSFKEILKFIAESYQQRKDEINKQNESLMQIFNRMTLQVPAQALNLSPIEKAINNIVANYDEKNGGFGDAPKFPQTNYLELLLRQYVITGNDSFLQIVQHTLEKMAKSGLYDQIGGGFFRYSIDADWQIPHFEKMLYDNAQLLMIYTQAYAITKNPLFAEIIEGIAHWVMREMQSAEGGYFATLDADSEGQEGKFYIWSKEEIEKNLNEQEYAIIKVYFGLEQPPNFEQNYHLHVVKDIPELSKDFNFSPEEIKKIIQTAKQKLFQVRTKRIYPHRDEKILTAWNGLMLGAMAMSSRYLSNQSFLISAQNALKFLYENMWHDNQLMASYKDHQATIKGYLDDYVFLINGIVIFLQAEWQTIYSDFMLALINTTLNQFEDKVAGGFFFTAHDHEKLFYRPKNIIDEAIPAGNGVAALVLNRVGYLTGTTNYLTATENTLKMAWHSIEHYPDACVSLLFALQEFLNPLEIIIVRGKKYQLNEWQKILQEKFSPLRLMFAISEEIKDLPAYLQEKKLQGDVVAYICKGFECSTPVIDISKL